MTTTTGDGDFLIFRMDTMLHFYTFNFLALTTRNAMLPEEIAKASPEISFAIIAKKTVQKTNADP